jgi:quercetin dioxygenase-like cupin family protein
MKRMLRTLAAGLVMVCGCASLAETIDTHKTFRPQEIKWGPGPAGLPAGAESAVLYGDPKGAGMFALRLKMPKGYSIAPHMHVGPEIVTVISGKFRLGLGQAADHAGMEVLPAGSFSSMPKGVVHYLFVDEESVIQINAAGPWDIDYVNPKDDPRLNGAPEPPKSQLYSSEHR